MVTSPPPHSEVKKAYPDPDLNHTQTRLHQIRPDQTRPNQTRPDQTRPNQTRPNQTRPDQTRSDQTRPDQITKILGVMSNQNHYMHGTRHAEANQKFWRKFWSGPWPSQSHLAGVRCWTKKMPTRCSPEPAPKMPMPCSLDQMLTPCWHIRAYDY